MIRHRLAAVVMSVAIVCGCASPQEYDAEPDATLDRKSVSVGTASAGERTDAAAAAANELPVTVTDATGALGRTDLLNARKLEAVPPQVRVAFSRDFPDAGITSIRRLDAATGLTLYEVNFLRNRRPYDVIYRPDGTTITRTPLTGR